MFEGGELDILDLDRIYSQQESFLKEEGMADTIVRAPREEIHFIVLNESDEVLKDQQVRKALQLGTDRQKLMEELYDGEGTLLQGILPPGVIGYDSEMEEIPYDREEAKKLLEEKDPEELEIRICCPESANDTEVKLYQLLKEQWVSGTLLWQRGSIPSVQSVLFGSDRHCQSEKSPHHRGCGRANGRVSCLGKTDCSAGCGMDPAVFQKPSICGESRRQKFCSCLAGK